MSNTPTEKKYHYTCEPARVAGLGSLVIVQNRWLAGSCRYLSGFGEDDIEKAEHIVNALNAYEEPKPSELGETAGLYSAEACRKAFTTAALMKLVTATVLHELHLVVLQRLSDDLPVKIFTDKREAVSFATTVSEMPDERLREVFETDCATPMCVSVVSFEAGVPVSREVVRDFEDEPADPWKGFPWPKCFTPGCWVARGIRPGFWKLFQCEPVIEGNTHVAEEGGRFIEIDDLKLPWPDVPWRESKKQIPGGGQ